MPKKPFKVSARTARLIGRENVANAEGAIIELLKNCFDADSKICILYFDIRHNEIPSTLSPSRYRDYFKETVNGNYSIFEKCYEKSENGYNLKRKVDDVMMAQIELFFKSKNILYIIDNGDGMSEETIDNHWMTIGTNNKLNEVYTTSGRIRSGAKGIGRFALDRLGSKCKMLTKPVSGDSLTGYEWKVNWNDFEGDSINLHEVEAEFKAISPLDYNHEVINLVPDLRVKKILDANSSNHGTILQISSLRDWWTDEDLMNLFESLKVLSPPDSLEKFDIFLLDKKKSDTFGKVDNESFDDYDYKIVANVNSDKSVKIKIHRNEFNINSIDKDLFLRKKMQVYPYDFETFKAEKFEIDTNIFELLPKLEGSARSVEAERLGEFEYTFYYLKLTNPDQFRFSFKSFDTKYRKNWMNNFGGIKIFRDNFRVRPYGEQNSTSFDWLSLGERKAQSPAGVAKENGGYKVAPNQVAGIVKISRLANLKFNDKSSREGFQENETFTVFKDLLKAIVEKFEEDRSTIAREIDLLQRSKNEFIEAKFKADELLSEEVKDHDKSSKDYKDERDIYSKAYNSIKADYSDALEEIRILRALATTGLMVTSFAHEFHTLKNQMERRSDILYKVLKELLDEDNLANTLENRNNPFKRLEAFKKTDQSLKHWLDFSLAAVRKDKRNTEEVDFQDFIKDFNVTWQETLKTRKTKLNIFISGESLRIKAFVIDMESVFNNLLMNTFDAFDRKGFTGDRSITISIESILEDNLSFVQVAYSDSGPGIPTFIKNPYLILKPGYTTKVNKDGTPIGTGIGMYIVNSVVQYYNGSLFMPRTSNGFEIVIKLPYQI